MGPRANKTGGGIGGGGDDNNGFDKNNEYGDDIPDATPPPGSTGKYAVVGMREIAEIWICWRCRNEPLFFCNANCVDQWMDITNK